MTNLGSEEGGPGPGPEQRAEEPVAHFHVVRHAAPGRPQVAHLRPLLEERVLRAFQGSFVDGVKRDARVHVLVDLVHLGIDRLRERGITETESISFLTMNEE